jgi:hypothetical protein
VVRLTDRETLWITLKESDPSGSAPSLSPLGLCTHSCDFLLACIATNLHSNDKVSEKALSKNGVLYQVAKTSCVLVHMTLYEFDSLPSCHFVYDEVLDRLVEVDSLHRTLSLLGHNGISVKSFFIQSASASCIPQSHVIPYMGIGHVVGHCHQYKHTKMRRHLCIERRCNQTKGSSVETCGDLATSFTLVETGNRVEAQHNLCTPPCLYVGSKDDPR